MRQLPIHSSFLLIITHFHKIFYTSDAKVPLRITEEKEERPPKALHSICRWKVREKKDSKQVSKKE